MECPRVVDTLLLLVHSFQKDFFQTPPEKREHLNNFRNVDCLLANTLKFRNMQSIKVISRFFSIKVAVPYIVRITYNKI